MLMMEKKSIIKDKILKNLGNTYCRLKPSKLSGVGVFAVRDIPKNRNPFEIIGEHRWYEFKTADLKSLDKEVLKMIDDFFVIEQKGTVYIPEIGLNGINISFFLNHSKKPNVKTVDNGFIFVTLREIKKNEEITVSYGTYDWKYK